MNPSNAAEAVYLRVLRGLTPEQRLRKAFELSDFSRALFREGLRMRFPDASAEALAQLERDHIDRCRNNNY
jgi:hypothetical protein